MKQILFPEPRTWGGKRKGAGRKPAGTRSNVPHVVRPSHSWSKPVHVTLRGNPRLRSLRSDLAYGAIAGALAAASTERFRLIHFSVQHDHVHLIVEAADRAALIRGVQGLAIRCALAVNLAIRHRGRVWSDRYHSRDLGTPREVRNAIAYVLLNRRKHAAWARGIDRCSSGRWFDGWRDRDAVVDGAPTRAPHTWLAELGWRRCGLLALDERPGGPPS